MKLPNVEQAIVPRRKIVDYLLSKSHPDGQPKAVFFQVFGFTVTNWQALASALYDHARRNEVSRVEDSPFGTRFVIEGIIDTPVGRTPWIRSIWFIDDGASTPRLVSAYPIREISHD